MPLSLSLIIPVFSETPGLQDMLLRFEKILGSGRPATPYEILVIDDASADKATRLIKPSKSVKVIRHAKKTGYGGALKTGIREASHPVIVTCDADGGYAAEALTSLLGKWSENGLVVADRSSAPPAQKRWLQLILQRLLAAWVFFLTYRWIGDIHSGFRVFSKAPILPFLPDLTDRSSFTAEHTLLWLHTGSPVQVVPTISTPQRARSNNLLAKETWGTFQQTLRLTLNYKPLRLVVITAAAGFFLIFLGLH